MTSLKSFSGTVLVWTFAALLFAALVVFTATPAGSDGGGGGVGETDPFKIGPDGNPLYPGSTNQPAAFKKYKKKKATKKKYNKKPKKAKKKVVSKKRPGKLVSSWETSKYSSMLSDYIDIIKDLIGISNKKNKNVKRNKPESERPREYGGCPEGFDCFWVGEKTSAAEKFDWVLYMEEKYSRAILEWKYVDVLERYRNKKCASSCTRSKDSYQVSCMKLQRTNLLMHALLFENSRAKFDEGGGAVGNALAAHYFVKVLKRTDDCIMNSFTEYEKCTQRACG